MEKDRGITIKSSPIVVGHVDHGKTTLTHAILHAMSEKTDIPMVVSSQGSVSKRTPFTFNHYNDALMREYELIKQKKSKLSRRERDRIVRKVEQSK